MCLISSLSPEIRQNTPRMIITPRLRTTDIKHRIHWYTRIVQDTRGGDVAHKILSIRGMN
jgi:hypothetical protein